MKKNTKIAVPVAQTQWKIDSHSTTTFHWDYVEVRRNLHNLYEMGKTGQWDAAVRINWNEEVNPANPMGMPDNSISIFGSDLWNKMDQKARDEVRQHLQSYQVSNFLHGEQ